MLLNPQGTVDFGFLLSQRSRAYSSTRFHSSAAAYTDQAVHTDVFLPLTLPAQANSFTQTFTFPCRSLHMPTRPQGHFLLTDIIHTGLLAHTDTFQSLLGPTQPNLSKRKFPFVCCSLSQLIRLHRRYFFTAIAHVGLDVQTDHLFLLQQTMRDSSVPVRSPNLNERKKYTISRPYLIMGAYKNTRQKSASLA